MAVMAAPDDSHLNPVQKRLQAMKDDLKNLGLDHLQSFLDGISDPEPPDYQKVNGRVEPSLQKVSIKQEAHVYHVGNVIFTSENNEIQDTRFMVQDGEAEIYTSEPLTKEPANAMSVPITDFVMIEMLPLWHAKYKAIKRRMLQINDVRSFAHNAPNSPEPRLSLGTTLTKLMDTSQSSPTGSPKSHKRASGEAVRKHSANKRARIGLASIPDSVKSEVFARLPDKLKRDLFNNIAQTAFPNFDDMILEAWNVVSVYESVGTDGGELHHSVTELKAILQEFDATYGKERRVEKVAKEEKTNGAGPVKQEISRRSPIDAGTARDPVIVQEEEVVSGTREHNTRNNGTNSNRSSPLEPQMSPKSVGRDSGVGLPSPRMTQHMSSTSVSDSIDPERMKRAQVARRRELQNRGTTDGMTVHQHEADMKEFYPVNKVPHQKDQVSTKSAGSSIQVDRNTLRPSRPSSSDDQYNNPGMFQVHSSFKPKGRNVRPTEMHRQEPHYHASRNEPHDEIFEDNIHGTNGSTGRSHPPQNLFLGNSKLGQPKNGGNRVTTVPEAPMMHTQHVNNNKDVNETRQS